MKRILIGTMAVMMTVPCFAEGGGIFIGGSTEGGYSCTINYICGNGSGNTQTYTHTDANNKTITVANSNCSKPGDTFSHWNVSYCIHPDPVSNSIAHPGESYNVTGCLDDVGYALCFTAVYASETGQNVLTSKPYVDDAVSTRQDKIPAANPSNTNLGETVMTYTDAGDGEIGERELFTGGTYNAANDADKLITASALKSAFTLPETQTTKLVCANPGTCNLWTITNQTAYGMTPFNPDVSINGTSQCYRQLNGDTGGNGTCGADTLSYLGADGNKSGKWGVVFPYGDVSGISVCSTQSGTYANAATSEQSAILDSDFAQQSGVGGNIGGNCWCKMENPTVSGSPWVFGSDYGSTSNCAAGCANLCGSGVRYDAVMRGAVFGIQ